MCITVDVGLQHNSGSSLSSEGWVYLWFPPALFVVNNTFRNGCLEWKVLLMTGLVHPPPTSPLPALVTVLALSLFCSLNLVLIRYWLLFDRPRTNDCWIGANGLATVNGLIALPPSIKNNWMGNVCRLVDWKVKQYFISHKIYEQVQNTSLEISEIGSILYL